jgi:hypothetical protein
MPREARADATASPASPPPTITTLRPDAVDDGVEFFVEDSGIDVSASEEKSCFKRASPREYSPVV